MSALPELSFVRDVRSTARQAAGLLLLFCFLLCGDRLFAQSGTTNTLTSATANDLQDALDAGGNVVLAFNGTITVNNPIVISTDVILDATTNSITISGGGSTPIFLVEPDVNFEVRNLTISGGKNAGANGTNGAAGSTGSGRGGNGSAGSAGTSAAGGAIFNEGTNVYINCIFFTNSVVGGSGGNGGNGGNSVNQQSGNGGNGGKGGTALGGAIYNLDTLILSNCTFNGNAAIGGNGGTGGTNGSGPFATSASTGAGGSGGLAEGAAVYNATNATITILACTFLDNFSEGGSSQSAASTSTDSNGQTGPAGATARGGGIFNAGFNTVINSTFFANLAVGGNGGNGGSGSFNQGAGGNGGSAYGGCIYNENTGTALVTNCTFDGGQVFGGTNGLNGSGSHTSGVGAIGGTFGANIANNSGVFQLKNSILAYPTNAVNAYSTSPSTITDKGFNISTDTTPKMTATGSHNSLNPLLGSPANNGGPTKTISFQGNSPAKDVINDGSAPPLDQRGSPRPIGLLPDIGAFEFGTPQYSISGNVGTATAGVLVYATGTNGQRSLVTDSLGNYSFTNLAAGTYTITPPPTNGFSFTPTNRVVTVPPSTNGINFSSTPTYTIAGVISSAVGSLTVNLYIATNGGNTFYTHVDTVASNGLYTFNGVPAGAYTIIPQSSTYAFVPASISLTVPPSNTNENFNAVPPTYSVSGQISNVHSPITLIATLGTSSSLFASILSDANGIYSFANLPTGTYTITPQQTNGYTYTPGSLLVTVPPSTNAQNFSATQTVTSSVSGQVSNLRQAIGITAISSTSTNSVSTDGSGNYSFAALPSGTYNIAPQPMSGVTFAPSSVSVILPPSAVSKNFAVITSSHPAIGKPQFNGSQFSFTMTGTPNIVYRIQTATNLASGVWTDILTNTAGADGTLNVTNNTTGAAELFYRAVSP